MRNITGGQFFQGMGRLYDPDGKQVVAYVMYMIRWKPATEHTLEEWSGYFNANHPISIKVTYIIELEDGRRGSCIISEDVQAGGGLDTVNNYGLQGSGSLT